MVNLFGHGFVGSHYAGMYPCLVNDRNDLVPGFKDVLYMISTVDNYHVKTNPYIDIETNLTTLIRVLENWRHRHPDGVFNFVSSWFVYGDTDLPALEDGPCNPTGFYSITKRTAEQLLISYCETFNLNYRILRLANVLGPGDRKVSKKKNALTYIINQMKEGNPVDVYNGGEFVRDYVHVKDLCRAINLVVNRGDLNTIYNIGNGEPVKFIDVVNYVKELGSKSPINIVESKNVQATSMYMNTEKLQSLGYRPEYSIQEIVKELYNIE